MLISRDYYGGATEHDLARDERGGTRVFASRDEAQDWIDEDEDGVYVTDHNEVGRPDYKIIRYEA